MHFFSCFPKIKVCKVFRYHCSRLLPELKLYWLKKEKTLAGLKLLFGKSSFSTRFASCYRTIIVERDLHHAWFCIAKREFCRCQIYTLVLNAQKEIFVASPTLRIQKFEGVKPRAWSQQVCADVHKKSKYGK